MAKFIIFNKLVDLRRLTINMDTVKTMEPVSKLYDGHMRDCTDIYYENHRVTVLSGLDDIMNALTNMSDGDVEDISEVIPQDDSQDTGGSAGHGTTPEDPEIPVVYTTIHIDQYARYLVNDDSQHQILLTDNGMSNPWPTSAGSTSYTIDLPEDQDYVYLVYEKIYTGNHQYNNWSTLNIYADESSAEQFLENLTITNSSDTTIEPLGPVQVPLNEIFDIESDSLEPPGSITKIYMSHTKTDQGSNHSNMIIFGPGSTPGEANDVAQTGNGSEIELPLPSGEEVEADATGRYPFYLVYWITYKSKGGNKPFKKRIIYNAKSSRAFATRDEAIIYAANKNEGVDIDTMGYEYKWALLYTGIKYVLRSNGVIVKASDGFY